MPVSVGDGPGQWGNAGMHARRERGRVDVVLDQQDLRFRVLVADRTQLPHVVPHRVQRVSLPTIHNHHYALASQCLCLQHFLIGSMLVLSSDMLVKQIRKRKGYPLRWERLRLAVGQRRLSVFV